LLSTFKTNQLLKWVEIKGLNSLYYIVVSCDIQVFFVEIIFSGGLACRLPVFLRNEVKPEQELKY
jgi:hypothetical protein